MVISLQNIRREKRERKTNKQFYDSRKMEETQVFYYGIGPEQGKIIEEDQAFDYALERCLKGTLEDQKEFREMLVEWFYSGNWIETDNAQEGMS